MKKKKITVLLASVLALSILASACGTTTPPADDGQVSEDSSEPENPADENQGETADTPAADARVDVISTENGDAYFYVPTSSELLSVRTCTTPILVVMGDSDYTEASVLETAETTGIAQIADEEGAIAVFLNSKGDSWSADDVATYTSIFTNFSDDSNTEYIDGKSADGIYAGSLQRIYVFAEGSAADFVAQNFNAQLDCFVDYGMYQLNNDVTPAYTAMFNPTVNMPEATTYSHDIPMGVVNAADTAQAETGLAALTPVTGNYFITEGDFDAATIDSLYQEHMSTLRRQSGVIIPIPDLTALQMTENVVSRTTSSGDINCYEYSTDTFASAEASSVPLVVLFHGGGNHAQYFAWASGWLDIASAENLYVVSVDKHVAYTSTDIIEILDQVQAEYPQIDKSRIYASGFSMGAVKCWNLAIKYPEYFAGIMPCDAGYLSETGAGDGSLENVTIEDDIAVSDTIIPLFYVAGGMSFTDEDVALDDNGNMNNVGVILQRIFTMNQIADDYFYDESKNVNWGIETVGTETVRNTTFENDMEISSVASQDGTVYTQLCYDVEKGHETYEQDAQEAWKFIKQFSRNEDGTLTIN